MSVKDQQNDFSFVTPELTHRIELILHLLEYSNHLVIVKGEHESGKSTLCQEIARQDESNLLIRHLNVNTHTTTNDIFRIIIDGEIKDDDTQFSQFDLDEWLGRCQNKQQVPAVLIDNIDLLDDERTQDLLEIIKKSNDASVLHACIFCEPSFIERLEEPGIKQDESQSLHIIEMPALNEKQTEQYIHSKYPNNGNTGLDLFDNKTIKQIHRISHGMPGRINALCDQYLDDPAKKTEVSDKKPLINFNAVLLKNKLILAVTALLAILSISVATLLQQTDSEKEPQTIKLKLPGQAITEEETAEAKQEEAVQEPEPVTIEELSPPVIPEMADDVNGKTEVIVYNAEGQIVAKESELAISTEITQEQVLPVEEEKTPVVEPIDQTTIEPEIVAEPAPAEKVEPVVEPSPSPVELPVSEPAPPTEQEDEKEAPVPTIAKKDINWLIKQDTNKYVLQLIGAYEQETIDLYLKSFNANKDPIIEFSASNKGREWHVLVYGFYENRDQAVSAIDTLPAKAKTMAPWPRTVGSIKDLLQ